MKNGSKRRAWTAGDMRTLKSLARKKSKSLEDRESSQAYRGSDKAKGTIPWSIAARQSDLMLKQEEQRAIVAPHLQ
jgi:hypothetical protein